MMKIKFLTIGLIVGLVISCVFTAFADNKVLKLKVNNTNVNSAIIEQDGVIYVPIAEIADRLGLEVIKDEVANEINIKNKIGNKKYKKSTFMGIGYITLDDDDLYISMKDAIANREVVMGLINGILSTSPTPSPTTVAKPKTSPSSGIEPTPTPDLKPPKNVIVNGGDEEELPSLYTTTPTPNPTPSATPDLSKPQI